ncbi:MAG TPA: MYXO-CTERM sorting domain-containing protein [Archangium sp.]|nr:MYXO-CTERM sorting domain-containing protein [Archangium sp.]
MGGGGGAGYGTNNKGGAGGAGGGIIFIRAGAFQNNNTYEQCTSPMSYTGLTDGEHTFEVFATDAATNKEKPQARRIWTVVTSTRSSEENSFLGGGVTSCSATGGDASLVLMGLGTFLTLARRRRRGSSST